MNYTLNIKKNNKNSLCILLNGKKYEVNSQWLYEHSDNAEIRDPYTKQLLIEAAEINPSLKIIDAQIEKEILAITFSDNSQHNYKINYIYSQLKKAPVSDNKYLWNKKNLKVPKFNFKNINNKMLFDIMTSVDKLGFCLVRNIPKKKNGLNELMKLIGPVKKTNWGGIADVKNINKAYDLTMTTRGLENHTDNPYRSEDFKNYPRTIHNDLNLLRNEDVDIVFLPIENEILKYKTFYKCPNFKIENILCGKSRPNYFPGVKNIVIKLFDIVQADNSFFGEKDYQQLVVIKKLRDELNFGTKIIPIKTVRNKNGLPLSSRNKYLEINEIEIANKINKICKYLIPKVKNKLNTTKILAHAKRELRMNGIDKIDYLTILTDTLEKRRSLKSKSRIFIAANVGSTRLIDNFPI